MRSTFKRLALTQVATSVCVVALGCSQEVHVRTQTPGAKVTIAEQDYGVIDERGVTTEIAPGTDPVPYTLEKNGKTFRGEILRSETSIPLVVLGIGLAACAVPSCVLASCAVANPTVVPALALGVAASTGTGGFVAAIASPSWLSVPCVATGAATGLTPLLFLPIAKKTPEFMVLGPPWKARGRQPSTPGPSDGDAGRADPSVNRDDEDADLASDSEEPRAPEGGMAW